jgi:hypothetical protein
MVRSQRPGLSELNVEVEGRHEVALNYDELTGPVKAGDEVLLNTTAVHKKLGTGGTHFVMGNCNIDHLDAPEPGHIMKMRYTPSQIKVLSVEEPDSPHAAAMAAADSLAGMPVVVATLHSMLAPVLAGIHAAGGGRLRVVYLMTDGAALPLPLSRLVPELKAKGLLTAVVTCGHAFGGDLEAVNVYSGLLAARVVAGADVTVTAMGPGIVGTGTKFGFTGLEQGELVNAVHVLGGRPLAVPRISFADARARHRGLSHHTATALGRVALAPCTVPLPHLPEDKAALVKRQLDEAGITTRHRVVEVDGTPALKTMEKLGLKVTTMGRSIAQDPEFFLAAGAAGLLVVRS